MAGEGAVRGTVPCRKIRRSWFDFFPVKSDRDRWTEPNPLLREISLNIPPTSQEPLELNRSALVSKSRQRRREGLVLVSSEEYGHPQVIRILYLYTNESQTKQVNLPSVRSSKGESKLRVCGYADPDSDKSIAFTADHSSSNH